MQETGTNVCSNYTLVDSNCAFCTVTFLNHSISAIKNHHPEVCFFQLMVYIDGLYRSDSFVCMLQLSFMPSAFHRIMFSSSDLDPVVGTYI